MINELKLIQTHLGVWKLEDWTIGECAVQLNGKTGVYCLKNLITDKVLIGEGYLGGTSSRLIRHINGDSSNKVWQQDIEKHNIQNIKLDWIIIENDEIIRKIVENKLQLHFKENCYNTPRRKYPTQNELLNNIKLLTRIKNYNKSKNGCWNSGFKPKNQYSAIRLEKTQDYFHHVLMYILHYGDVCGISSVIHHKCENKKCVNPNHLELTTNIGNSHKHHKSPISRYVERIKTSRYLGVDYEDKTQTYRACSKIGGHTTCLGRYSQETQAAENRDYYLVKNNLLSSPRSTLNFHSINYNNFKPWPMYGGKINKYIYASSNIRRGIL